MDSILTSAESPTGFHVMAKPAGPACNLACRYCFYLEKSQLHPKGEMPAAVLESYISQFIESQPGPVVTFAWQGGEPTLMGLPFFEQVIALQQRHARGKRIENTLQTNGILIDDDWAAFLQRHAFLVGLSIDGPEEIHDAYRIDRGGRPTFQKVMAAMERLKKHRVEFNTLTCVHAGNADNAEEVYRFLKKHGGGFMQFIPVVERIDTTSRADGLTLIPPDTAPDAVIAPWSVAPEAYGRFLCTLFDTWVRNDVGRIFVQLFDIALEAWVGLEPSLCLFRKSCGEAMALEYNGDLYACDHYVYPEYRLGNILETPITELALSDPQRAFGTAKQTALPKQCRECPVLFACRGECPKHRFLESADGEKGLNYFCAAYRKFFTHIDPCMRFMVNELSHQRPPANVMAWIRGADTPIPNASQKPLPNTPCPCGSGQKYKRCCGRK